MQCRPIIWIIYALPPKFLQKPFPPIFSWCICSIVYMAQTPLRPTNCVKALKAHSYTFFIALLTSSLVSVTTYTKRYCSRASASRSWLTSRTALHCSVEFVRCEQLHWKACVQNTISRAHSSNFSSEPVVKVWNSLPPRTGDLFFSDNIWKFVK